MNGHYIITDPNICHGQTTFRGTRIIVWQVLEMVAEGLDWDYIVEQYRHDISKEAIAEAVTLAGGSIERHSRGFEFGASDERIDADVPQGCEDDHDDV